MKVKASVKVYKKCKTCKIVRRKKGQGRKGGSVLRVICENPKHEQRQG